jgi:hypothetical protein
MTDQSATFRAPGLTDAGAVIDRLRQVLALVRDIAGERSQSARALDEAARLSGAYASALPIVQRRFDEQAVIVARWAATGLEALLILEERARPVKAAANRLADELERAMVDLARIVSV